MALPILIAALAGLVLGVSAHAAAPPSTAARSQIGLAVAAHQHLISPASVSQSPAAPPKITLPPEIQDLLRRREGAFGAKAAPPDLYTPDAQVVNFADEGAWVQGEDKISDFLGLFVPRTLHPTLFKAEGSTAYVGGAVFNNAGIYRENFLFTLAKGSDGKWRIAAEVSSRTPPLAFAEPVTAEKLIQEMDDAGVRYGVALSIAYWYGSPLRDPVQNEYEKVRAENDWNVEQAEPFRGRIVVFCGVNPLKDYAIGEMERCSRLPNVKGIKLHLGNSRVDLTNAEHVRKMRAFFGAADRAKMALVVHTWTSVPEYGAQHSTVFLNELLPAAPNTTVQIAHLAGAGIDCQPDAALEVFAAPRQRRDPRTRNLYFDVTQCVGIQGAQSRETLERLAMRMRQIGLDRILVGSDTATDTNPSIGPWWWAFRRKMPLTDAEIRNVADNVPPYLR